jgi:hypothetical protein
MGAEGVVLLPAPHKCEESIHPVRVTLVHSFTQQAGPMISMGNDSDRQLFDIDDGQNFRNHQRIQALTEQWST